MIDSLRTLYPQVVKTIGEEAFDADGNIIEPEVEPETVSFDDDPGF